MTIKLARKKYDPDEIVHICEGIIDRAKDGKTKAIAIVEITDDNGLLYSAAQAMRCTQLEFAGAISHLQSKFITTNGEFE
jgi:hypothetical protein